MTTAAHRLALSATVIAMSFAVAACTPILPVTTTETQGPSEDAAPTTDEARSDEGANDERLRDETPAPTGCDWDAERLRVDIPAPTGQSGDLASILIGSWQHVALDDGSGFTAPTPDIRYVFPSLDSLIYCQHLPGVTEYGESSASMTLDGTRIAPPEPHPGWEVIAWDADRMLWTNNMDGSTYLLVRR